MEGEAWILQQRVELLPLKRCGREARERVRGEQGEQDEGAADHRLHGEGAGFEARWQIVAEERDQRAEEAEDQHPQQQRPFMLAPGGGDLVDERRLRMGMLIDHQHREISDHEGVDQRAIGNEQKGELAEGCRLCQRHPGADAALGADQRQGRLRQGQHQCQDQSEMADFDDHGLFPSPPVSELAPGTMAGLAAVPAPSCQRPEAFNALATSGGR